MLITIAHQDILIYNLIVAGTDLYPIYPPIEVGCFIDRKLDPKDRD